MSGLCFRMLAGLAVVMTVTGCVTTQPQADGSTKVHLSLGGVSTVSQGNVAPPPTTETRPAVVANQAKPDQSAPPGAPGIRATALAGVFSKHSYDGTPKTYGRLTKVGVLSAGMEGGEATLTCTVNIEGSEG